MANPSQYLVHPDTGEVGIVPTDQVSLAKERGFTPASGQQIKDYDARKEAEASPVLSTLKSAALGMAPLFSSPLLAAELARTALGVGASSAEKLAEEQRAARETMALLKRKPVEPPSEIELKAQRVSGVAGRAADIIAPFTPEGALIATGLQTREQIEAEREVAGLPGSILSLAGAVVAPAALAKTALSGAAKGARALALEEQAAIAAQKAATLSAEGAPGAAAAVKASEEAARKLAGAVDSAAARRALLAKVPGGEKIAQGLDKQIQGISDTSALKLVSESVGRPVSQVAERSARALIDKAPALGAAPQVVKDLVAKSIASGAGSSADLVLLGLANTSQEAILGDTKITTERALANMTNGAIDGFELGVALGGVPTAMGAAIAGLGVATRSLGKTFNQFFPRLAAAFTGAEVESVEALRQARGDIRNAGEIIERRMAERQPLPPEPAPFVPGVKPAPFRGEMPAMVGVENVGMVPEVKAPGIGEITPLERLPRPEPAVKPTPLRYVEPELSPVETEQVTEALLRDMKAADKARHVQMIEFNKFIRPGEEEKLFEQWHKFQQDKALSEAKAALGGRMATPADAKAFEKVIEAIDDIPRNEALRLTEYARGAVKGVLAEFPDAVPTGTLKQMLVLADKLERASLKDVPVIKTYRTINSVKRQNYDLAPAFEQGEVVTQVEAKARRAARQVANEMARSTEVESIWGPNAVRQSKVNDARTRVTLANKNIKRLFGRKEDVGLDESTRAFSSDKIAKFVKNPTSAANSDKLEAFLEWQASLDDLRVQGLESAKSYAGETGLAEYSKTLGDLAKSYTEVENTALRKIDFEYAKQQAKQAKVEYQKFNDELEAEFNARKAEEQRIKAEIDAAEAARKKAHDALEAKVEQFEGERKLKAQADLELVKARNAQAKVDAKARLDAFKAREAAAEKAANEQRAAWEATLKQRQQDVAKQVQLLQKGAKLNDLSGAVIMYEALNHPVLAGIATAAKNPALTYKVLNKLEQAAKATDARAKAFVDYLETNQRSHLAALEPAFVPRSIKQEREEYEKRVKKVRGLMDDVNEMTSHLSRGVEQVESSAPNIADHARSVQTQAITAVAQAIPQPPPNLPPFQMANWQPTDSQIREWNRLYESVAQPTTVMHRMAQGTATQREIDMISAVYSNLMDDLRKRVTDRLKKSPDVSAARRAMLSKMFRMDMDGAPALGVTAQPVYGQQRQVDAQKQAQAQMPLTRAQALKLPERAEYALSARRNAQTYT